MKKSNKIVFIGAIDKGHVANNGETIKNQFLLKRFEDLCDQVISVDADRWRKRPWCFAQILWALIGNKGAKVVISASSAASLLYSFLYYVPLKRHVSDWVIGGALPQKIKNGTYSLKVMKNLKNVIVEGYSMVEELRNLGMTNVVRVPNFKAVDFIPNKKIHTKDDVFRFVFLSRVHPSKGLNEIFDAADLLVKKGFGDHFSVDIYGPLDAEYKEFFMKKISESSNVFYKGFMNLTEHSGYEKLSEYDVMLFPTYWRGEGFPGIVIDAYMAGLPIIATDWNLNKELVVEGKTGTIIPIHDSKALVEKMLSFINGDFSLIEMQKQCLIEAQKYDYRNVVTKELLESLGILEATK